MNKEGRKKSETGELVVQREAAGVVLMDSPDGGFEKENFQNFFLNLNENLKVKNISC